MRSSPNIILVHYTGSGISYCLLFPYLYIFIKVVVSVLSLSLSLSAYVCVMDIVCGKASTTVEMQRLEAQLLPMGTGSLSNKQVLRPEGHVQK